MSRLASESAVRWRKRFRFACVFTALGFGCAFRADAQTCVSENGFALGELPTHPSLGLRLFSLSLRPEFPMREAESLRIHLAQELLGRLAKSGFFGSVRILADDEADAADYVLSGIFANVSLGANTFSLQNLLTSRAFDDPSSVSIVGAITRSGSAEPATTFDCGVGYKRGTPASKARKSLSIIADNIAKVFSSREKARREREE